MTKGGIASASIGWAPKALCAATVMLWTLPGFGLELEPARVGWDRLLFEAENQGTHVSADIRLAPARDLEQALLPVPRGLEAAGAKAQLLHADVRRTSGFFPLLDVSEWRMLVWFQPDEAAALQRMRRRFGDEPDLKIYRYADDGVHRRRSRPRDSSEAKRASAAWSKVKTSVYPYPAGDTGCTEVSDPSLLLYISSAAALPQDGAPVELCVFNKKTLYHVELRALGSERLEPGHLERQPDGENVWYQQRVDAVKVLITARPARRTGRSPEPFEFFELRGDIEVLLDPALRLPLRIRGQAPFVGRTELALTQASVTRQR